MGDPKQSFHPTSITLTHTIGEELLKSYQKINKSLFPTRIYRVPKDLRKLNKSAYIPRIISIGPLHCKEPHLQTHMQDVKKNYAYYLFSRVTKGMNSDDREKKKEKLLQKCVEKMMNHVDRARKFYAEELKLNDDKMVEMMLVDGCFILELLYASYHTNISEAAAEKTTNGRDSGNPKASSSVQKPIHGGEDGSKSSSGGELPWADPVIDNILTADMIKQDLILLENQIPFFVLEELFKVIVDKIPEKNYLPLTEYVLRYFGNIWSPNVETRSTKTKTSCCLPDECVLRVYDSIKEDENGEEESRKANDYYHILHFLHEDYHYHRVQTKRKLFEFLVHHVSTKFSEFKVSAADLHNAGVEFIVHYASDVSVTQPKGIGSLFRGVRFQIPSLLIHERTEVFLRNLIALEQCCPKIPRHFTSYVKVMSMLINSEKDVQVFKDAGIIHNYLGTDKDVPKLFDKLCEGVTVQGDLYLDAWQVAIEYYKGRNCLPMTMRYWTRLIFTSTWGVLAFALGIITSLITVAQFVRDFRK